MQRAPGDQRDAIQIRRTTTARRNSANTTGPAISGSNSLFFFSSISLGFLLRIYEFPSWMHRFSAFQSASGHSGMRVGSLGDSFGIFLGFLWVGYHHRKSAFEVSS